MALRGTENLVLSYAVRPAVEAIQVVEVEIDVGVFFHHLLRVPLLVGVQLGALTQPNRVFRWETPITPLQRPPEWSSGAAWRDELLHHEDGRGISTPSTTLPGRLGPLPNCCVSWVWFCFGVVSSP